MHYFFPLPSDADRLLESVDLDQEDVVDRQEVAHLVFASSHSGFMKSLLVYLRSHTPTRCLVVRVTKSLGDKKTGFGHPCRWQSALNEHGHQARQTSGKLLVWLRLKLDHDLAKRALQCTTRLDVLPRDPICRDCFATRRDAFWCYRIGIARQERQR